MRKLLSRVAGPATIACAGALALAPGASASAASQAWGALTGCPVDNAAMLAVAPGGFGSGCVFLLQHGAHFNVGTAQVSPGFANPIEDFGVAGATQTNPSLGVVVQSNSPQTLLIEGDAPLVPPNLDPTVVISDVELLCERLFGFPQANNCNFAFFGPQAASASLFDALITMEPAGQPSDFGPAGLAGTGPALTLPVKFKLGQNKLLGNNCYVGSDSHPVVLHLAETTAPTSSRSEPDPDGYPVTLTDASGEVVSDTGFAEPGATGCGPAGVLDPVVDALLRLPSKAGRNSVTIDLMSVTAWTTAGGPVLSQAYHAALG